MDDTNTCCQVSALVGGIFTLAMNAFSTSDENVLIVNFSGFMYVLHVVKWPKHYVQPYEGIVLLELAF